MATVEWIGQARRDGDNSQANPARLINCYRENIGEKFIIKSVPGMTEFAQLNGVFMREMAEVEGIMLAACGGELHQINSDMTTAVLATIPDGVDTTISGNNGDIAVASDGTYTLYSGGAASNPTTGAISSVGSVSFLGQRTILTEKGGAKIQWSDVADASAFDPLDFATAESRDDNLIRGAAISGQFWAFGERSTELWYLTGAGDSSSFLAPLPGSTVDTGLMSFGLLAEFPNGAFFIGHDGLAYLVSGGQMAPVSSRGVETSIKQKTPQRCFYYEDEGHKFCVIQFADRPAWVYDLSSNEWHERAEGSQLYNWSAVAGTEAYGASFVGTELGGVYKLERTNMDGDEPLIRKGVSRTLEMEGNPFTINRLQISIRTGRADVTELQATALEVDHEEALEAEGGALIAGYFPVSRPAKMFVRFSKNRGETWGPEKWRSLGSLGDYGKLVRWHAQGSFYRANVEFTIAEPAEIPMDAIAFLEVK